MISETFGRGAHPLKLRIESNRRRIRKAVTMFIPLDEITPSINVKGFIFDRIAKKQGGTTDLYRKLGPRPGRNPKSKGIPCL